MRAVSIVVRDATRAPVGVVCINLNIGVFEQARALPVAIWTRNAAHEISVNRPSGLITAG